MTPCRWRWTWSRATPATGSTSGLGGGRVRDPEIWDEISGADHGVFQIETEPGPGWPSGSGRRSVAELADVITLVRPGPVRLRADRGVLLRRREGTEDISLPDPRLVDVLAPTQGVIIYQEQVMKTCQILGGYTLAEADEIRKILGKKKKDKVKAAGREFVSRCAGNGMTKADAQHLWDQLGEFALYAFNKSHAYAYAIIGCWTSWTKYHYPIEFMTAVLSTVDKKRIPEFTMEARRMGYRVQPPDINESGAGFTASSTACRYGFASIEGLAAAATQAILRGQPYASFDDFMARKGAAANRGVVKTLVQVGAFDSLGVNRRQLMAKLDWEDDEQASACAHMDPAVTGPNGLPCTYDWATEPVTLGKSGRPLKAKPLPQKCFKGCRQYQAPAEPVWSGPDYSETEVQVIEKRLLGVHLTSTPFDMIDDDIMAEMKTGSEVDNGPPGIYTVVAIITKIKTHMSRGGSMAFVGMYAQDMEFDVTVFHTEWLAYKAKIIPDHLCMIRVNKNAKGITLIQFASCQKVDPIAVQSQSVGVGA